MNTEFPTIDTRIEYVGASKLRSLNTGNLGKLKKMLVIQDNDTPLAVLLNYEQYLIMQNKFQSMIKLLEVIRNTKETAGLLAGLRDAANGQSVDFSDIEASIPSKTQ